MSYIKYKEKYLKLKHLSESRNSRDVRSPEMDTTDILTSYRQLEFSGKSYIYAKIDITDEEVQILDALKINDEEDFDYMGILKPNLEYQVIEYFKLLGNSASESQTVAKLIYDKIAMQYLNAVNAEALWITIRPMFPNTRYNTPRWHYDGYFYDGEYNMENDIFQTKLAIALKGPQTVFKQDSEGMRQSYWKSEELIASTRSDSKYVESNKQKIDEGLKSYPNSQAPEKHVAIFVVGSNKRAAIHSEPPIHEPRLFMSIVAGTSRNIKDLADRWDKNFNL